MNFPFTNRRHFLGTTAGLGAGLLSRTARGENKVTKSVAAIVTVYRKNSHADVIVSKILKGWKHDGGAGPALRLASLYVDQFPDGDMSRKLAREYGFPIVNSVSEAITLGTDQVAVDGVLSIGEERGKGNSLVRKTDALFRQSSLNYIGNIEGSDTFCGDVDVIVCDGFVADP